MLDSLNLLYDSKIGGNVPPTIFRDSLTLVNRAFVHQCEMGVHDKGMMESYCAHLSSDSREFRYNHYGLEEETAITKEMLGVIIKTNENGKSKVM